MEAEQTQRPLSENPKEPEQMELYGDLPSAQISSQELRNFYDLLCRKSSDAKRIQFDHVDDAEIDPEVAAKTRKNIEKLMVVALAVLSDQGFGLSATTSAPIQPGTLPDKVEVVQMNSSTILRNVMQINARNSFDVRLDFTRATVLDFSSSTNSRPDSSRFMVIGENGAWVNDVKASITNFFESKKTKRAWLYKSHIYDFLLWFLGVPVFLTLLSRLSTPLTGILAETPTILTVGVYVYLVLLFLFSFRILFNYARWLYPYFELSDGRSKPNGGHKALLYAVSCGLLVQAVVELVSWLWKG